ncbi:hypothetical protein G6O69_22000 [Pseudenhygromyxa sp. WMMC2535]|uniref:hypothetical protein n=1 Tax=Pseudenhygromyxa sp. WMMC2535 TaxID=2712867 RepID=UPI0015543397|nr:hypothetical protein [Pseudenhygromyxa sp. WMMC2535]NVB40530.1 hypothetical protein [Pseudenhygromyxa sp. WMMC2535]
MRRSWIALALLALACDPKHEARSRELLTEAEAQAKRAAARAGEELDQARERYEVDEKVERAREELAQVRERAGEELDQARERYEVDAKVERAREELARGLDEAAKTFDQLAQRAVEEGREQGAELSERLAYEPIPGAAEAVDCEASGRRCTVSAAFIDALASDPSQLGREAVLLPGRSVDGVAGLRLSKLEAGSLPALLGLRDGDLLLEVNGVKLASFDAIRELDAAFAGRSEALLRFERGGNLRELTIVRVPSGPE